MPVRIAAPTGIGGLIDTILNPGYSTAVGLLLWGASTLAADEPMRYESAPASGGLGRLRDALRSIFPRRGARSPLGLGGARELTRSGPGHGSSAASPI